MAERPQDPGETRRAKLVLGLRSGGVTDAAVLNAIEGAPRDLFVPQLFQERAWEDSALPIACGQTISQPLIVGLMTQALQLKPRHRVLEIGTGSGYQTVVLARIARYVYTVERYRTLLARRRRGSRRWACSTSSAVSATAARAGRSRRRSTASWSPPPLPRSRASCWPSSSPTGCWLRLSVAVRCSVFCAMWGTPRAPSSRRSWARCVSCRC